MVSLKISDHIDYQVVLNIYPGIIKIGNFSPGIWTAIDKTGKYMIGISTIWIPGIVVNKNFILFIFSPHKPSKNNFWKRVTDFQAEVETKREDLRIVR